MNIPKFRSEFKYFLPIVLYKPLLSDLEHFTIDDLHGKTPDGFYPVSSIYFETMSANSYMAKVAGVSQRIKLRIRFYSKELSEPFMVELKYKRLDKNLKIRKSFSRSQFNELISHPILKNTYLNKLGFDDFLFYKNIQGYLPFIRIDYERKALFNKLSGNIRITFDRNIVCSRFDSEMKRSSDIPSIPKDIIIFEVKSKEYFPF